MKKVEKLRPEPEPLDALVSYEPPSIAWEEQLELAKTLAASCAMASEESDTCNSNPG